MFSHGEKKEETTKNKVNKNHSIVAKIYMKTLDLISSSEFGNLPRSEISKLLLLVRVAIFQTHRYFAEILKDKLCVRERETVMSKMMKRVYIY